MQRFREDRPTDICFARGTFNSHPYVMAAMHEFLRRLDTPEVERSTPGSIDTGTTRRSSQRPAAAAGLPVRVANLASISTIVLPQPSRYNWMFQYYLRAEGLALSWVGSGRLIFSHNYSDADFSAVARRFVGQAARCGTTAGGGPTLT